MISRRLKKKEHQSFTTFAKLNLYGLTELFQAAKYLFPDFVCLFGYSLSDRRKQ